MNIEEQEKVLRNLFSSDISSLFKQKKELEYTYCIWGTSVLFEIYPFDMERKNIKRGRKLAKTPSKKSGKFQHFLDAENKVVAIYGYTDNYDLPAQYIFFEYRSSEYPLTGNIKISRYLRIQISSPTTCIKVSLS